MSKPSLAKSLLSSSISQHSKLFYGIGLTALLTIPAQQVLAGGFQLSDHSITSLGRNHAGYGVVGDDASAVQFNPAGLTLLKKRQAQFGLTLNSIDGEVENDGSNINGTAFSGSDDDGTPDFASAPNAYYIHPINDRLVFGLGITAPFGTDTDYDDDFFGRFSGTTTELTVIDINPSIGYKINDIVSVGFGVSYQTLDVTLDSAIPLQSGLVAGGFDGAFNADGDSEDFGFNVGITFNLPDNSRIGLSYRSGIEHDIDVDAEFIIPPQAAALGAAGNALIAAAGDFDASADFESPATAYLGYYKPLSDNYFLTVGVRWTEWSVFNEIRIEFDNQATALTQNDVVTEIDWENSFTYAIGLDGRINDKWTWRTGLSYTETPVPTDTRSVRTIDSDRTAISFGATYNVTPKLALDFAYRYISFDDADINQSFNTLAGESGATIGEVEAEVHTVAIQANYKF